MGLMVSDYREGCIRAKAARAGIIEQRGTMPKAKKAKPIVVEFRYQPQRNRLWKNDREWRDYGNYRSADEAQRMIDGQMRKHPTLWEFRIKQD